MPGSNPQANLILAFEYKGGWRDVKGAVVMTVLTFLLGGGSSFSSGGPGKGMHSRLYTRVLNQHHWVHSCSAFSSTFNSSGEGPGCCYGHACSRMVLLPSVAHRASLLSCVSSTSVSTYVAARCSALSRALLMLRTPPCVL